MSSSVTSWRVDTPGATEALPRLMSARRISENAGGALLPTLTVCGNWNRAGASAQSGDGLATALNSIPMVMAPTLLASDARSSSNAMGGNPKIRRFMATLAATDGKSPYSAAGYQRQTQKRSKPLRDSLVHETGIRLTPIFAEWWMGFPLGHTMPAPASKASATRKSRSKPRSPGCCSEDRSADVLTSTHTGAARAAG